MKSRRIADPVKALNLRASSPGIEDIDNVVARREADPVVRARMKVARQRIARKLGRKVVGLAALRLRRGLSQKQLAEAIGTSQPHIARMENGRDNVLLGTANELARALGVSLDDVNAAFGYRRRM